MYTTHNQRPSSRHFLMDDCRTDVNTISGSRTSGRSSRQQSSSDVGEVHLRLYQRSLPRQQKGKELRKKIEKAQNPTPSTVLRVTENEAKEIVGRLYRPVVKERNKVVPTEPERKKSPKIDSFKAQRLYEKLYAQQKNHGDGNQTSTRNEDNAGTSTVEVQERSVRRMTEGNAQSLFQRLHSETLMKDQQNKNQLKESKSDRNVRLIHESSAKKLFERLHTEKKKADVVKPSQQKRGPSLDKRTAEGLFQRLHLEKKKGDLIQAPDPIRGPRRQKSADCIFERLHKEKMGKVKSS